MHESTLTNSRTAVFEEVLMFQFAVFEEVLMFQFPVAWLSSEVLTICWNNQFAGLTVE